jgi:YD repeat-containing protein
MLKKKYAPLFLLLLAISFSFAQTFERLIETVNEIDIAILTDEDHPDRIGNLFTEAPYIGQLWTYRIEWPFRYCAGPCVNKNNFAIGKIAQDYRLSSCLDENVTFGNVISIRSNNDPIHFHFDNPGFGGGLLYVAGISKDAATGEFHPAQKQDLPTGENCATDLKVNSYLSRAECTIARSAELYDPSRDIGWIPRSFDGQELFLKYMTNLGAQSYFFYSLKELNHDVPSLNLHLSQGMYRFAMQKESDNKVKIDIDRDDNGDYIDLGTYAYIENINHSTYQHTLQGHITCDALDPAPAQVKVYAKGDRLNPIQTVNTIQGDYQFNELPEGYYDIIPTADEYRHFHPEVREVYLSADQMAVTPIKALYRVTRSADPAKGVINIYRMPSDNSPIVYYPTGEFMIFSILPQPGFVIKNLITRGLTSFDQTPVDYPDAFCANGYGLELNQINGWGSIEAEFMVPPEVVYVTALGNDANSGISWDQAKATPHAGVELAKKIYLQGGLPTQVWVAAGHYICGEPGQKNYIDLREFTDDSYAECIDFRISMFGGFPAVGGTMAERDWKKNTTILDGDVAQNDGGLTWPPNSDADLLPILSDNVAHLISLDMKAPNEVDPIDHTGFTLDGFTLRGGTGTSSPKLGGGAIIMQNASPTIRNCTFTRNFEPNVGANEKIGGGAIACRSSSKPIIANCRFVENAAGCGGALALYESDAVITNCIFSRNNAIDIAAPNSIGEGFAGAIFSVRSDPQIANCLFTDNKAFILAGAIYSGPYYYPVDNNPEYPVIVNCTFSHNEGYIGGAMCFDNYSFPEINNSIIWDNHSVGINKEIYHRENLIFSASLFDPANIESNVGSTWSCSPAPDECIEADPLLDDEHMLGATSPCIVEGNIAKLPADVADLDNDGNVTEPVPFDLAGKARNLDGLDIGAYEYFSTDLPYLIAGIVKDAATGAAIINLTTFNVSSPENNEIYHPRQKTDGSFRANLHAGTFRVTINHPCYEPFSTDITVPGGDYNFLLTKRQPSGPAVLFREKDNKCADLSASEWGLKDPTLPYWEEPMNLQAVVKTDECFDDITIASYQWFRDGVVIGGNDPFLTPAQILVIDDPHTYKLVVTDSHGNTGSFERTIRLLETNPELMAEVVVSKGDAEIARGDQALVISENGGTELLRVSADVDRFHVHNALAYVWDIDYESKNGTQHLRNETSDDIPDLLTVGYGKYTINLRVSAEEAPPIGTVSVTATMVMYVTFPKPFVLCPPYGCRSAPILCEPFFENLPLERLDATTGRLPGSAEFTQQIEARRGGIAFYKKLDGSGFWGWIDHCAFKTMRMTGDFEIVARLANGAGLSADIQAGLMLRPDNLTFGTMLFLGKQNGATVAIHRPVARQDVAPYVYDVNLPPDRTTHDWLRIKRDGGVVALYSAASALDGSGPANEAQWGSPIPVAGHTSLSGFEGALEVGLAAADKQETAPYTLEYAEFDHIQVLDKGLRLAAPPSIYNTVFAEGNLIANWGFENDHCFFGERIEAGGMTINPHFEMTDAFEGRFAGKISNKIAGSTLATPQLPAYYEYAVDKPVKKLRLNFKYRNTEISDMHPTLRILRSDNPATTVDLPTIPVNTGDAAWRIYDADISLTDATGELYADAYAISIELINKDDAFAGAGSIFFDNVLLHPLAETEENSLPPINDPVTTITFADGLQQQFQVVQPHTDALGSHEDIVAATILDQEGRVERTLPVFVDKTAADFSKPKDDPVGVMSGYFQDQADVGRPYKSGETPIAIKPMNYREDHGRVFYDNSPLNRTTDVYGRESRGFLDVHSEYLTDNLSDSHDPMEGTWPHHTINSTITGISGRRYSYPQRTDVYKNPFGQVVKTVARGVTSAENLVSTRQPDVLDRTWSSTSPQGVSTPTIGDFTSTYRYDTFDKVVASNDPDAGATESMYDRLGNLRLFRDANKIATDSMLVSKYDVFSRVTEVYMVATKIVGLPPAPPVFNAIKINFQPAAATTPAGYFRDIGGIYDDQGDDHFYGWLYGNNTLGLTERPDPIDLRMRTSIALRQADGDHTWEIAVADGAYHILAILGDPRTTDQNNSVEIEGNVGSDSDQDNFDEVNADVNVADGYLTLKPTVESYNLRICFVEITPAAGGDPIKINFQPSGVEIPAGYLSDNGMQFGLKGSGYTYGWVGEDNIAGALHIPNLLTHTLTFNTMNNHTWELRVPNGVYNLTLTLGDITSISNNISIMIEDTYSDHGIGPLTELVVSNVHVTDGNLSLRQALSGDDIKICAIEVTPVSLDPPNPTNPTPSNLFTQAYADDPTLPQPNAEVRLVLKNEYDAIPIDPPPGYPGNDAAYTKGRLTASHSYSGNGVVSQFISYDYRGRAAKQWLVAPGLPAQMQTFRYNMGGQVTVKTTTGQRPDATSQPINKVEMYTYDELNRLKAVFNNGEPSTQYLYWPDGKVRFKNFGTKKSMTDKQLMQSIAYQYDATSRLQKQRHEAFDAATGSYFGTGTYEQALVYNEHGNITAQDYLLSGATNPNRRLWYLYDQFNRLTQAHYYSLEGGDGDKLSGSFQYSPDGAITRLAQGPLAAQSEGQWGEYEYLSGSHRLSRIKNRVLDGGKDRSAVNNYVFDQNGNIIEDKGLLRRIYFDYRNMPERIVQYSDNSLKIVKYETRFIYDAGGNRIAKVQRKGGE